MGLNAMEIARMAKDFQTKKASEKPQPKQAQTRTKIIAGTKAIGDHIGSKVITGLGKTWVQFIPDHETSAWGLQPGRNYRVDVQYAYCS